jgi:hypothetical protein
MKEDAALLTLRLILSIETTEAAVVTKAQIDELQDLLNDVHCEEAASRTGKTTEHREWEQRWPIILPFR